MSYSRTQRCSAGEAWTHGHSVSSQALYHDSKSQSLNPENKLLDEMKKKSSCYFFAITFLSSILAKCVYDKAVEETFRQFLQKVWCLLHIQILCTVKPQKFELRFFEILANSKWTWDTLNSENRTYSWSILTTFYNSMSCGMVFPTILHFDKCRLGRASAASF